LPYQRLSTEREFRVNISMQDIEDPKTVEIYRLEVAENQLMS
jgi:hypothetical protein